MDRNKRLIKNTFIYFIGNLSSKILSFLLLPLYTYYLTPKDYGKVDLIFTYTSILIPLFTLQITFAGFRFLFETVDETRRKVIISSTFFVHLIGMLLFCLLYILFWIVTKYEFGIYVIIYVLLNDIATTSQQIIRGIGKNTVYAITGTVGTAVQLLFNIVFILGLGLKSLALILSPTISYLVIIIIIIITTDVTKYLSIRCIDKVEIKKMLKYSVPLVPDAVCWWVLLGFDRLFLNYTHGTEAVGIYAVASKFPGLLTMLYSVYNLAWQENAFSEYSKGDRDEYYSKMYNGLIKFLFPVIITAIPITKIIAPYMLSDSFNSAYLYIPILFISALISMMSSFYGSGFESAKQTNGIMVSTFVAMITNVIFNLMLVPNYGLFGTSIALVLSYVSLFIMRVIQSRKFFNIRVDKKTILLSSFLLLVSVTVYYYDSISLQFIIAFMGIIYFFILNYYLFVGFIRKRYQR